MTPQVRNHLFQVLRDSGVPETLLAELMAERRSIRDEIVRSVLPFFIPSNYAELDPIWRVKAAREAYALAVAVLHVRDTEAGI